MELTCRVCGKTKDFTQFLVDKRMTKNRATLCKQCHREGQRASRLVNVETASGDQLQLCKRCADRYHTHKADVSKAAKAVAEYMTEHINN